MHETKNDEYALVHMYFQKKLDIEKIMAQPEFDGFTTTNKKNYQKPISGGVLGLTYDPSNDMHNQNVMNARECVLTQRDIGYNVHYMLCAYVDKNPRDENGSSNGALKEELDDLINSLAAMIRSTGQKVTLVYQGSKAYEYIHFPGHMPEQKKKKQNNKNNGKNNGRNKGKQKARLA